MWNIAKFPRKATNANIRQAKKEFLLSELKRNEKNAKSFEKPLGYLFPRTRDAQVMKLC